MDKLLIKILQTENGYTLCREDRELASSSYKIEQVGEDSSNYKVWVSNDQFVIYNIQRRKCIRGGAETNDRRYNTLENYSIKSKSFVCYTYVETQSKVLYCAQLIFDDGYAYKDFFSYVSDEKKGIRIVQLYNIDESKRLWLYFAGKDYAWDKKSGYKSKLGHKVHCYGTMHDTNERQYLWYYDTDYRKFHSERIVKYDEFEEVENSSFFVGKNYLHKGLKKGGVRYRLFYARENKCPIASEEYFDDYLYDSKNKVFQVKTEAGWTLVYYDDRERDNERFEKLPCISYYSQNDFRFIDDLIFARKGEVDWDISDKEGTLYSCLWKRVKLSDDESYILVDTFREAHKRIYCCKIKNEYLNALNVFRNTPQLPPEKEKQKYYIDYYRIANAEVYKDDVLGSDKPIKKLNLIKKPIICWVVLKRKKAFIVRYNRGKMYDILFESDLNEKSIVLYNSKRIPFKEFKQEHSADTVIDALYLLIRKEYQDQEKAMIVPPKKKLSEENRELIASIQECFEYLSAVTSVEIEKVYDAISILFEDKTMELYGISPKVDELLSRLSELEKEDCHTLIDNNLIAKVQREMLPDNVSKMNLVLNFHMMIQGSSLADALSKVYESCPFGKEVEEKINEKIVERKAENKVTSYDLKHFLLKEIVENIYIEEEDSINASSVSDILEVAEDKKVVEFEEGVAPVIPLANRACVFHTDEKDFSYSIDKPFCKADLTNRNRKYVRKDNVLLVFVTKDEAKELDVTGGCYKLLGEGEAKGENQHIGHNANADIAKGKKRILIFENSTNNELCSFYDEVKYIGHEEIDDPTLGHERKVLLFKLESLIRFK